VRGEEKLRCRAADDHKLFRGRSREPLIDRAPLPAEVAEVVLLSVAKLSRASAELFITLATVKNHAHNILDKLSVRTRADAAAWFRRYRIDRVIDRVRIDQTAVVGSPPAEAVPGIGRAL